MTIVGSGATLVIKAAGRFPQALQSRNVGEGYLKVRLRTLMYHLKT